MFPSAYPIFAMVMLCTILYYIVSTGHGVDICLESDVPFFVRMSFIVVAREMYMTHSSHLTK